MKGGSLPHVDLGLNGPGGPGVRQEVHGEKEAGPEWGGDSREQKATGPLSMALKPYTTWKKSDKLHGLIHPNPPGTGINQFA